MKKFKGREDTVEHRLLCGFVGAIFAKKDAACRARVSRGTLRQYLSHRSWRERTLFLVLDGRRRNRLLSVRVFGFPFGGDDRFFPGVTDDVGHILAFREACPQMFPAMFAIVDDEARGGERDE